MTVGKSYYRSDEFLYQGKKYYPIGTFGIGFLACFMLSDSVAVETKHYTEQEGITIELEKDSEYICKKNHARLIRDSGTAIILNLDSVLELFVEEEYIKEYLEDTFLDQRVQFRFITIDNTRKETILKLKALKERNPKGVILDSYLNGISACWNFQFGRIKVYRKFSELCSDRKGQLEERIYAEYNYDTGKLCIKDIEGRGLKKYIVNDHIMILKIQAIKEEKKESYASWKQWHISPDIFPTELSKYIYIPFKYDEYFLTHCCSEKKQLKITLYGIIFTITEYNIFLVP